MWQLWSEAKSEEGIIHDLEYESEHRQLIQYMKQFLSSKSKGMCYVIRHVRVETIF